MQNCRSEVLPDMTPFRSLTPRIARALCGAFIFICGALSAVPVAAHDVGRTGATANAASATAQPATPQELTEELTWHDEPPRDGSLRDEPAADESLRDESLRAAVRRLRLPLPLPRAHIVVLKSRRRLELWSATTLVRTYRVALGATPSGHKQRQGDGRTPEGRFYICTRNASTSAFHIFLGLSYPALPDAARAAHSKTISRREYRIIGQRLASRAAPLWRTRLGGWVGIHGGTGGALASRRAAQRGSDDWTGGCIALTDREIEEVYAATRLGTPVTVRP